MEISSLVLTVLIPFLACCVYYCHHLQRQLADYKSRSAETEPNINGGRINHSVPGRAQYLKDHGSSVWCQGSSNVDRRCIFRNLCYHTEHGDFVFLHSPRSIYEGIPEDRRQPALADLSSVSNHNTQYFDYVDVPSAIVQSVADLTFQEGKYLLFNRFNPGNLMHLLHDDLIPVFYTLLQLGLLRVDSDTRHATLLMSDGQKEGEHFHLYKPLSETEPILVHQLRDKLPGLVCFDEVHVGLSKYTTWYQYGFEIPQGPPDDVMVTSREIKLFTSFYKSWLALEGCPSTGKAEDGNPVVILSRRTNRLILNEVDLSLALARKFNAFVVVASLETHSLPELIRLISCSKGLVAVHGSLLALSVFLPSNSVLVEIFPYAVNPDSYTPYRTLAHLKGMKIAYRAWQNEDASNTVTHPGAEPEFGGIAHLDEVTQMRILSSTEVPLHLCCNDPTWLFRIYQDTVVDVESFLEVMNDALAEARTGESKPSRDEVPYHPGPVREASCHSVPIFSQDAEIGDEIGLVLSWQPPWNLPHLPNGIRSDRDGTVGVEYEVMIQEQGSGELYAGAFVLPMTSHTFVEGFKRGHVYYAWIRCKTGLKTGPYAAITSCPYNL